MAPRAPTRGACPAEVGPGQTEELGQELPAPGADEQQIPAGADAVERRGPAADEVAGGDELGDGPVAGGGGAPGPRAEEGAAQLLAGAAPQLVRHADHADVALRQHP